MYVETPIVCCRKSYSSKGLRKLYYRATIGQRETQGQVVPILPILPIRRCRWGIAITMLLIILTIVSPSLTALLTARE